MPEHFCFHDTEAAFYFFGRGPTLSALKSNRTNDGTADLKLETVTGLPIACEAGHHAPLRPGSVNTRSDFTVQTTISCDH